MKKTDKKRYQASYSRDASKLKQPSLFQLEPKNISQKYSPSAEKEFGGHHT